MHPSCPEPLLPQILLWAGPAFGARPDIRVEDEPWWHVVLVAPRGQFSAAAAGDTGELGGVRGVLVAVAVLVQWTSLDSASET